MYFWKYILAKKAGLSQQKCNMALYGLPVLPIAEAFEKTVTGNPITITDALAQDALSLKVAFEPSQDGTPSIDSEPTTEPYLSKVVPRGNKEYYSLVGGTVAWNQLVQNGDFADTTKWSAYNSSKMSLTIANEMARTSILTGGTGGYNYGVRQQNLPATVKDHYYLVEYSARLSVSTNTAMLIDFEGVGILSCINGTPSANVWNRYGSILKANRGGYTAIIIEPPGLQFSVGDTIDYKNVIITDLTLLFANNPSIADYAYTLEQQTAGAGVQWLKDNGFFTEEYYPFNAGELMSVNTSGHKVGSTTYPIQSTDLRGLFKLSSANKLYCDGDTYPPSGTVSRKYAIADLGTLDYTLTTSGLFQAYNLSTLIKAPTSASDYLGNYISMYTQIPSQDITGPGGTNPSPNMVFAVAANGRIFFNNTSYTDAATFKAAMSGQYLVYELATPTTETLTPYTSPVNIEAGGTEEFIDNRTVPIPVGNETYYASEFAVNGKTSVSINHSATSSDTPTEYEVEFTSQGTVYGGTVDIVTGVLTVTWGYIASYNGEILTGRWMSSKDVYAEGTTPSTGAEVAYELTTPQVYNLTPQQVTMLLGNNYLETEDGTITITYMARK